MNKKQVVKETLEALGCKFEHPTLILEGKDGWFVILTPRRTPHQVITHYNGEEIDFSATVPELLI